MITIGMSCVNNERTIREAIQSVLNQSIVDWILLVRITGSIDNTKDIVEAFAHEDKRIKVEITTKQMSWYENSLVLISKVSTKYFMFLDPDDVIDYNYLEENLETLRSNQNLRFSMGWNHVIDENGQTVGSNASNCVDLSRYINSRNRHVRLMQTMLLPESFGAVNILYSLWELNFLKSCITWTALSTSPEEDVFFTYVAISGSKLGFNVNTRISRRVKISPVGPECLPTQSWHFDHSTVKKLGCQKYLFELFNCRPYRNSFRKLLKTEKYFHKLIYLAIYFFRALTYYLGNKMKIIKNLHQFSRRELK